MEDRGLTGQLAVAQIKQMGETQLGLRAQYLAVVQHYTLHLTVAGGKTRTVDTHLARTE